MSKQPYDAWYKTSIWQSLRTNQLAKEPLCQISKALGEIKAAEVVDHVKPHKGDWELFVDPNNLQSVTKQVHDTICQQMELGTWQPPLQSNGRPSHNDYLEKIYKLKRPKESIY